jgi:hypothetical protein
LRFKAVRPTINEYVQYFTKKYGIEELLNDL